MPRSLSFVLLFFMLCAFSQAMVKPLQTVTATVTVTQCDSLPPVDIRVTFTGQEAPWNNYVKTTDSSGIVFFDSIETGVYDLELFKIGYQTILYQDIIINENYSLTDILSEKIYPARNLVVDSITSVATWDEPLITALPLETFEDTVFPPPGWQISYDQCTPWYRAGPDEPFGDWVVPEWEGHYALYNDELQGGCPAAHYNYLITPEIDLRDDENYKLTFDLFFEGWYGEKLTIRYSVDSGQTWVPLTETYGYNKWRKEVVDLSAISGANGLPAVMLAFVYFDGDGWAAGAAVDNIQITGDSAAIRNYYVSLDGNTVAVIPPEQTAYTFTDLIFGQYYTASVRAAYVCSISEPVTYTWQSGYLYQPGNLETEYTNNTDEVLLTWNPPVQNGQIPQGLLSFNIYRNDSIVVNVPYLGQQPDDELLYIDNNVFPDDYVYKVTALYDLIQFGYAGETGESGPSNEDNVVVKWGYVLPFEETWIVPNFEFNQWNIDTICWKINNDIGNEAPSAQFSSDSVLTDYQISLSSVPFRGDFFKLGYIWLNFNLKLDDNTASGTEHLLVEVYNGETWQTVFDTTNNGSFSFDDCFKQINVSEQAFGNIFRVRFRATGDSSSNISSWFVDNINIYRTCKPPQRLVAKYICSGEDDYGVIICWEPPDEPYLTDEWLHWDDGINFSAVGVFGEFSAAIRWDADSLYQYHGNYITAVNINIYDLAFDSLVVKIWTGENANNMVYRQNATDELKGHRWNMIHLDTPVKLEDWKELWMGYSLYNCTAGTFSAGVDQGPAVTGYGDKISTDGVSWDNLTDYGLNYNWNIQVWTEPLSYTPEPLPLVVDDTPGYGKNALPVLGTINYQKNNNPITSYRAALGFKIYRSETGTEDSYIEYAFVPYSTPRNLYCYNDMYPNVEPQKNYWYKVSAFNETDNDNCESPFARSKYMPDEDYVTVLVTGVNDKDEKDVVTIYPNPANERVTVSSPGRIMGVSIVNYFGQRVYSHPFNSKNSVVINTSVLVSGIYLVKIKTESNVVVKRIVIIK